MGKSISYEERTEALLIPFAEEHGIEIVDVEFEKEAGEWYLRIYIDKEGGVGIDDCELISRYIDPVLDEEDFITQAYTLEVSSPGLTRPLKKEKDFIRHSGDYVELKLYSAYEGYKDFVGILKAFDADSVTLEFEEGETIRFERKNIAVIRPAILF